MRPADLPPCTNIPAKVERFGKLGGTTDPVAKTLTLPEATVDRVVITFAKHIDRENALELCARTRGLLPPDPDPPSTPAPIELTP